MNKSEQNVIPAGEQLPAEQMAGAVAVHTPTPMEILAKAMDRGIPVEQIKLLQEMQREWEANEARKAFVSAMAKFRAESITILKNRHVKFKNKTGGFTEYDHATLDAALDVCVPKLSENGLFHRWETVQKSARITVTCIITEKLGHSERATLSASPDESGGKNSIQAVGSTVSYLERYTFFAAVGLATKGHDTDGRPPADGDDADTITDAQATLIQKLIKETSTAQAAFLDWIKAETIESIPAVHFNRGMAELNRKKRAQQANKEATK